jgi:hypothetical protein
MVANNGSRAWHRLAGVATALATFHERRYERVSSYGRKTA